MAEYLKPFLDLRQRLPRRLRTKPLLALVENLFNRHLTKPETTPLFGWVGQQDASNAKPTDIYLTEPNLDRSINQLGPVLFATHATEEHMWTWEDLLQRLQVQGVDFTTISRWCSSKQFNFAPPIDFDKFVNFSEYLWIGPWVQEFPLLDYTPLGIPDATTYLASFFTQSNPSYLPEYYVVERGELDPSGVPLGPQPTLPTWSPWSFMNLWVHKDDVVPFFSVNAGLLDFADLLPALRPIIEYDVHVRMNTFVDSEGAPSEAGTYQLVEKVTRNQPPLFDLYHRDGTHAGLVSSIFHYKESPDAEVDAEIGRRLVTDQNIDFVFSQAMKLEEEVLFYKHWNDVADYDLESVWQPGPTVGPRYVKFDNTGQVINPDKLENFRNYYWTGVILPSTSLPSYNPTGSPEYYVIERGASSDWSVYNFWTHVSNLNRSDLPRYVQANRPIVEFNILLDSELLEPKTAFEQRPRFNHYFFNQDTDDYETLPAAARPFYADEYQNFQLVTDVEDLAPLTQVILNNHFQSARTFEAGGHRFLQGLYNGYYKLEDGPTFYGFSYPPIYYTGAGDGTLSIISVSDITAVPEVYILTAINATTFSVTGTVTGAYADATVGAVYNTGLVAFTILAGATPFVAGDQFLFELRTPVWQLDAAFVKLGSVFKTVSEPAAIAEDIDALAIVDADINLLDGVWEFPPQFSGNIENENRADIKQGDLYFHFSSIIGAQPDIVGNEFGKNNWRTLPAANVGLAGQIHQFNDNFNLLVSLLIQEQLTIPALIEFARTRYEEFLQAIKAFVESYGPDLITDGTINPPVSGTSIDSAAPAAFKELFKRRGPVVDATETQVDDFLAEPFYDTTSEIENLVVTLPYLGLVPPVQPEIELDLELNIDMLTHHDGHKSRLYVVELELIRATVGKSYQRSNGQVTPGLISGGIIPERPFMNQFWYNTANGLLSYYRVVSDTGELTTDAEIGDFSYDRQTNQIWEFNGVWNMLVSTPGNLAAPWTEVKFDLFVDNLTLALETELYDNVGPRQPRVDDAALQLLPEFPTELEEEFLKFASRLGIVDPYAVAYDPANPFTWNYRQLTLPTTVQTRATWQEIYRLLYGTPRPDLEPWVAAGVSEATFLAAVLLPSFDPTIDWANVVVQAYVDAQLILLGRPSLFFFPFVVFATGALNPPAITYATIPLGTTERYQFGDIGPTELVWRKTTDFPYGIQKAYFKLDPLHYVNWTWGYENQFIELYELDREQGTKLPQTAFRLHSDPVTDLSQHGIMSVTLINPPLWSAVVAYDIDDRVTYLGLSYRSLTASNLNNQPDTSPVEWLEVDPIPLTDLTYTFRVINRIDGIMEVTRSDGFQTYLGIGVTFFDNPGDEFIQAIITEDRIGMHWGDTFTVTISSLDGSITTEFAPFETYRYEGWNQVYVQLHRYFGKALQINENLTFLRDWTTMLGYRFSGLVDTDMLNVSTDLGTIDSRDFKVLIKENQLLSSKWLNAVRVQLVQRGATVRNRGRDVPATDGADWIFRVDVFNPDRTRLDWYDLDTAGEFQTFVALNGETTTLEWKKYTRTLATRTFNAPFLLTGIQNVINFLYGLLGKLTDDGWVFNDSENPRMDVATGRVDGWQVDIEKWVDLQYRGVTAGTGYTFNQFKNKVWFNTPRGVVAGLTRRAISDDPITETLLNIQAMHIDPRKIRVFRGDEQTEIVSDDPLYTVHITTSEYEHVLLTNRYTGDGRLMLDQFLGQEVERIFLRGDRQVTFNGRLSFGGHYLLGNELKRNVENSVTSMSTYYDTDLQVENAPETEHARALLGFEKKQYFADRETTDRGEFRFWQGMIKNKGTNLSVNAFFNSSNYRTSNLDEYWAYKVAEYGDARPLIHPELDVEREDCTSQRTRYLFLEDAGPPLEITDEDGYDVPIFDDAWGFDVFDVIAAPQEESNDTEGAIVISPTDENRWHNFDDLGSMEYFEAEVLAEMIIVPTSLEDNYDVRDVNGNLVRADCFEVVDLTALMGSPAYNMPPYDWTLTQTGDTYIYRELGDYIPPTNPPEFTAPRFTRVNHSTIRFNDAALLGKQLKVVAYGPGFSKHSPLQIYDYRNNVLVAEPILWDPARGSHHPQAHASVDIIGTQDNARYNVATRRLGNVNFDTAKPWGKSQVGQFWWDTNNIGWLPYSDTKLFPVMIDRLALWGGLADYATVRVYEWVESPVAPADYEQYVADQDPSADVGPADRASGVPAIKETIARDRLWQSRTVAWKFSENPMITPRTFIQDQTAFIRLSNFTVGSRTATLSEGRFSTLGIVQGMKIGCGIYTVFPKSTGQPSEPFGTALVSSTEQFVIGDATTYDNGGFFNSDPHISDFVLTPDDLSLTTFFQTLIGKVSFSNETDAVGTYVRATFDDTGDTQRVLVDVAPSIVGAKVTFRFDQLGLVFEGKITLAYVGLLSDAAKIAAIAAAFGTAGHVTYMRSMVDVFIQVPFTNIEELGGSVTELPPTEAGSFNLAWIAWTDPADLSTDLRFPNNRFEALLGDWADVGDDLPALRETIQNSLGAPFVTPEGETVDVFQFSFDEWRKLVTDVREAKRNVTTLNTELEFYEDNFTFTVTEGEPEADDSRIRVFLNAKKVDVLDWFVDISSTDSDLRVVKLEPSVAFNNGDSLRVEFLPYQPTKSDLEFDPSVADPDPMVMTQYKVDYPYVQEVTRNSFGTIVQTRYFFWVKDKVTRARNKQMPVKQVQTLLANTDEVYGVIQLYRFYNQLNARPNRYGLLAMDNFQRYVNRNTTYKLRMTKNETLREDDRNIHLKNVHEEWKLIRRFQPTKIPQSLWDQLVNTACGADALGQPLPDPIFASYDDRNDRQSSFGLNQGQVMATRDIAVETLKYTIMNPVGVTFDSEFNPQPDTIAYVGFDINQLDTYFADATSTRQFMGELWNNARPKQLNELFFAVLDDALVAQPELADIFKTSFITLFDVRTIASGQ